MDPPLAQISGYDVISLLGRGSHGDVYRAVQHSTGQSVAVKVLRLRTSAYAPPPSVQIERFRRELAVCAALQHPNIVRAVDAGATSDGRLYTVFEYVPGSTLRGVLAEHRALPGQRVREFMLQTLDALASAHAKGVVHRDLKPENIMVTTTGVRPNFKVLDFGISALLHGSALANDVALTRTGESVGTPSYAAPEQLRGEPPTPRSDLYAWGLVVLECLTGKPAVTGPSVAEVHYRQLSFSEIRLPPEVARHPFGQLLQWALHKQPDRRASDAGTLYSQLERISWDGLLDDQGYLSNGGVFEPAATQPTPSVGLERPSSGERRVVSVLCMRFTFANARGDGCPGAFDSVVDGVLQEQRRSCERVLEKFGGQLVSFVGNRVLGIFGFPRAGEDDARRAALCAMEMHRGVSLQSCGAALGARASLTVSAGIHAGSVALRGDESTAHQVAGLVLAEAADLADVASTGEILVSAVTELAARAELECEPVGSVSLPTSGRREAAYRLCGFRDAAPEPSAAKALRGRQGELDALERQLEEVRRGSARCVWVQGEAGIGKSALVAHLRGQLLEQRTPSVLLRCIREEHTTPLHPVLALVRRELSLSGLEQLRCQLAELGLDPEALAPLLCPWLGFPLGDARPPAYAPQRIRELSLDALADLVLAILGRGCAVLVVEDAHWCDATTVEWLQIFRERARARPVLLVVTARPDFAAQTKCAVAPDVELALRGLVEADAKGLIADCAGDEGFDALLVQELVRRADGVPLFLQELSRFVRSHRVVSSAALHIPHSLRELLGARLDQLGAAKATAQTAAVIGREFDLDLLQRISTRKRAFLLGDVEQLLSAGLVEMRQRVAEPRYRFRHALLQSAAYDSLLPESQRQIHRRVAEEVESAPRETAELHAQSLARHWAAAEEWSKALTHARAAAAHLLLRSSHLELIEHCETALGWLERIGNDRNRIEHELALMLPYLLAMMSVYGYAETGVAALVDRVQARLEEVVDCPEAFNLCFIVAICRHVQGRDRKRAMEASRRLAAMVDAQPSYAVLNVFAWTALANCLYVDGEFASAKSYVERVVAEYRQEPHGALAWRFGFDAWIGVLTAGVVMDWVTGDLDLSQARLRELRLYAERLGHPQSLAQAMFATCVLSYCRRDATQLAHASDELLVFAQENRLAVHAAMARLFAASLTGDVSAIALELERILALGNIFGTSFHRSLLCEVELVNGNVQAALAQTRAGLEHADASGERFWAPRLLCQRAIASRRVGEPLAGSRADLDLAIAEASRRGMLMFELEATIACSTLCSEKPSYVWARAGEPLSRTDVMAALQEARQRRSGAFSE